MDNVAVRRAEKSDSAEIAEILRNDLGYDCSEEMVKRKLSNLDARREAVFVAELCGQVTGIVHVEKYELLYFDTLANILGLAVCSACRRRGIGKRLMQAAECWAKENGAVGVRVNSGASRTEAHEFYRSLGYVSEKAQLRFMKALPAEDAGTAQ